MGLVFHMPSLTELRAFPGMANPALREMLSRVFDLPVDAEEFGLAGVCAVGKPVAGRVASFLRGDSLCSAVGYICSTEVSALRWRMGDADAFVWGRRCAPLRHH